MRDDAVLPWPPRPPGASPPLAEPRPRRPPVLATKALRVELTGTEEALWRFAAALGRPRAGLRALPSSPRRPARAGGARGVARVGDPVAPPERRLRARVPRHAARRPLARARDPLPPLRGRPDPALPLPADQHEAARLHPLGPRGRARYLSTTLAGLPRGPRGPPLRVRGAPPQLHALRARRAGLPLRGAARPRWGRSWPRRTGGARSSSPTSTARRRPTPSCASTSPRAAASPSARSRAATGGASSSTRSTPTTRSGCEAGLVAGDLDRTAEAYRAFVRTRALAEHRRPAPPASTTTPGTSRSGTGGGTASATSTR